MPRVSLAFFTVAGTCGLAGMIWGIWMGASEQMATAPGHAHLNAVGFLGLAVMGTFHALSGNMLPRRIQWVNFWLSGLGAIVLPFGVALIMLGNRSAIPIAVVGGLLSIAGMALFLLLVLIAWRRAPN